MRRFGTDKVKNALISLGLPEDEAIRSKMFTRSVESAQKKVEGNNYDTRKSLLDYDNVMNQQREIVYRRRNELIDSDNVHKLVFEVFENAIADLIDGHIAPEGYLTEHDIEDILEVVNNNFLRFSKLTEDDLDKKDPNQVIDLIVEKVKEDYEKKLEGIPEVVVNEFEKAISLRVIDSAWVEHISTMEQLKEGIGLRGYAQSNPLTAYTEEGFDIFDKMQQDIDRTITTFLLRTVIDQTVQRKQTIGEGNQIKENEGKKEPVKSKKIGRNELCYCGSGKKYKQCHGKK
jgi:preprotein translocase subunit SecA